MTRIVITVLGLLCSGFSHATTGVASLADYCVASAPTHTKCIQTWLNAAAKTGRDLYASPGEWRYDALVRVWPGTRIRCAGPAATIFKRLGKASTFLTPRVNHLRDVVIEGCGFDVNGGATNFLSVIGVNLGTSTAPTPVRNITVRGNRFFDSVPYTNPNPNNQRQFVLLLPCVDCWVENNRLSEGGRIKVGRPGERIFIRNNYLEHVNDNAITVADSTSGSTADVIIDGNVIVSPVGAGIFFGSDGQQAPSTTTSLVNVQVSGNIVRGNWGTACIQATLSPTGARVHIVHNICHKTGPSSGFPAGIGVTRVDIATVAAQDLLISSNTVVADSGSSLDAGIAISGEHEGVRILGNQVRGVSTAIRLRNKDPSKGIRAGLIADNVMVNGGLEIHGGFVGDIRGNVVSSANIGFNFYTPTLPIRGTVAANSISTAKICMQFDGADVLALHVVNNTYYQCGGVNFFRDLTAGHARLHNHNDSSPNVAPTRHFTAAQAWTPTVAPNSTMAIDIPLSGARPGDLAAAAFDAITVDSLHLQAYIRTNNYVRVVLGNPTGAPVTLDGTLRVQVWRFN